jgi:hypothetical protein
MVDWTLMLFLLWLSVGTIVNTQSTNSQSEFVFCSQTTLYLLCHHMSSFIVIGFRLCSDNCGQSSRRELAVTLASATQIGFSLFIVTLLGLSTQDPKGYIKRCWSNNWTNVYVQITFTVVVICRLLHVLIVKLRASFEVHPIDDAAAAPAVPAVPAQAQAQAPGPAPPMGNLMAGLTHAELESLPKKVHRIEQPELAIITVFPNGVAVKSNVPEPVSPLLCAICYNNIIDQELVTQFGCKHQFHVSCVSRWLQTKNSCPQCRSVVLHRPY